MWVPPEIRDPVCRHAPTRKLISYFGAVRIRDGRLVASKPEAHFDAKTCWSFLRQLRRRSGRRGRRVIVIIDNARYHHATLHAEWRRLQEPGFMLLFLPPYSPNLNPIERVWKLLRTLWLHNRYFPTLAELTELVDRQFATWARPNSTLRKLCSV